MKSSSGIVGVRSRFARMVGRATRAIGRLLGLGLTKRYDQLDAAQWHRWYAANARNRRQLRAWKRMGAGQRIRLDPRKVDLPRWSVPIVLLAIALGALAVPVPAQAATATCVTDYRTLPSNSGWRRYQVVQGRRCWYVDAHRSHKRAKAKPHVAPPVETWPPAAPMVSPGIALVYVRALSAADRVADAFWALAWRRSGP
jgi:hypothetical protein